MRRCCPKLSGESITIALGGHDLAIPDRNRWSGVGYDQRGGEHRGDNPGIRRRLRAAAVHHPDQRFFYSAKSIGPSLLEQTEGLPP